MRIQPFCLPSLAGKAAAVVAATEVTVKVVAAEVEPLVSVTVGVLEAQVGRFVAPAGELVNTQLRTIAPE
jgi:hypothetical protein